MLRIVVFGAGGRAGRAAVEEARRRGHQVTAVVRDSAKYGQLDGDGVRLAVGDIVDAAGVGRIAEGHDAVINAAADLGAQPDVFFTGAARALLEGLPKAGVNRLVSIGISSSLVTESGALLLDTPEHPQEYRAFCLGHTAGTDVLRTEGDTLDWVVVSPSGDFDHGGSRTGRYAEAPARMTSRISYADFAIALLDEIDSPRHHRVHFGVETS